MDDAHTAGNQGEAASDKQALELDPLVIYLEPHFGNIYEDEAWTPELREAVTNYLLHEVADEDYAAFVDELSYNVVDGSRDKQAAFIVEKHTPQEVAYAFHIAAVQRVPTFQQLMQALADVWEYEDGKIDARVWLRAHAPPELLRDLARNLDILEDDAFLDLDEQLPQTVTPQRLLASWKEVLGPSPTDLTDQEWALLEPLIPRAANASTPDVVRLAINGMLWRQAHQGGNVPMPARYGNGTLISARKANYKKLEVFTRMLAGLEGKPEAERLVAWLREVVER